MVWPVKDRPEENMANIDAPQLGKRQITKKQLYTTVIVLFVFIALIFGYFFWKGSDLGSLVLSNVGPVTQPTPLFGIYGGGKVGALDKPMGVVEYNRKIFVTDTNNKRVAVFDYDGNPLYAFGSAGTGNGQFQFPYGITVDNQGLVYVADLYNNNIQVFTQDGKFVKYFLPKGSKTLVKPAGLYFFNNQIYACDVAQNKVFVFDANGKKVLEFGKRGSAPGQLLSPNFVIANSKYIYVSDTGNDRVEAFDPTGKFVSVINGATSPTAPAAFLNTRGLGIDGHGTLYVVSNLTNKVFGFDSNKFTSAFQPFGTLGADNNQFALPDGLFVDGQGRIYIADSENKRIMVWQN